MRGVGVRVWGGQGGVHVAVGLVCLGPGVVQCGGCTVQQEAKACVGLLLQAVLQPTGLADQQEGCWSASGRSTREVQTRLCNTALPRCLPGCCCIVSQCVLKPSPR